MSSTRTHLPHPRYFVFSLLVGFAASASYGAAIQQPELQTDSAAAGGIVIPAGTRVELALTRAISAAKARPGDSFDAQTTYPVAVGGQIAIPAGTYVQGVIQSIARPTRRSNRAALEIQFTDIVFANGYVVNLPGDKSGAKPGDKPRAESGAEPGTESGTEPSTNLSATPGPATGSNSRPHRSEPSPSAHSAATLTDVSIQTSAANDLLLDNGAEVEMTLATPLLLDRKLVAAAIPLTRPLVPGQFRSATECRPTPPSPGSPGTPDTVIPGNPGTPSVTIPGGPGMPPTTIPGTPATPATVIPGSPATPGFAGIDCPAPPLVLSSAPAVAPASPGKAALPGQPDSDLSVP